MSWWRRKPLHERLAEEGGLAEPAEPPIETTPHWGEVGIHGVHRPRRWDVVATADAPGLEGDEVAFVALPDGMLLVEDAPEDAALAPLADAVEASLAPPYRAEAVRRDGERWAVAARQIEVVELEEDVEGNEIELAEQEGQRTLLVDGARSFGSVPALERLARERYEAYVVHAQRLDGSLWEVKVAAL